jgi:hypothetical protein
MNFLLLFIPETILPIIKGVSKYKDAVIAETNPIVFILAPYA